MAKLLSPGPVFVPEFVQQALSQPVIHHRSLEFQEFISKFHQDLRNLFQTKSGVCTCMGSGTYGVEMAMYSLFQKDQEVLIVVNGKFSQRWADYGRSLGLKVREIVKNWGESPAQEEILQALRACSHPAGLMLTHSETSTGAILDLEEIAWSVKSEFPETLILVDAITSCGALPYYHDAWNIDCTVLASQKALMNPAGLVLFAFSELAQSRLRNTHASDFQNLSNHLQAALKDSTAYTPPVQLLFGVHAALKHIHDRGLYSIWNHVHHLAVEFRKSIEHLGGKIFPQIPSDSLTAFSFPNASGAELQDRLKKEYGLVVSGGQGELKGRILRVSHMGDLTQGDMKEVSVALEKLMSRG